MIAKAQGRSPLAYFLVLLGALAVSAGVVSAEERLGGSWLAGEALVGEATCRGSGLEAEGLRRVCDRAGIAQPRKRWRRGVRPRVALTPPSRPPNAGAPAAPTPVPVSVPTTPAGSVPVSPPVPLPATPSPPANPAPAPPANPPSQPPANPPGAGPAPSPAPTPTPSPTPEPTPGPKPIPSAPQPSPSPGSIYWGAWIGNHLTGTEAPWDMGAVAKLEATAGKGMSIVNFSSPFANCSSGSCSYYNFPVGEFDNIRSHGSIPFFSWGSQSIPLASNLSQPNFQLADVIAGAHDAYIRSWATAAKNWGKPFFLRFNWEMNGSWFAWMEGVNGNQPGESVAAWRHVHDIFTEVGATNATWVWCPNVDPDNSFRDLAPLYPGDAYVDWTGLDGYNWGTNPARPDRWRSFDELYGTTYNEIVTAIAPSKPMIVSEIGSTEFGGSKAAWITNMLKRIPAAYPKIRGLLWFEKYDDGMDWPLATSSSAAGAFAEGIRSSAYASNQFGSLSGGAVQPAG